MFEQLEKARSNTVQKIVESIEFKLFLVEYGWQGMPQKFLQALACSAETAPAVMRQIVPLLDGERIEYVLANGKNIDAPLWALWPALIEDWQPWQYPDRAAALAAFGIYLQAGPELKKLGAHEPQFKNKDKSVFSAIYNKNSYMDVSIGHLMCVIFKNKLVDAYVLRVFLYSPFADHRDAFVGAHKPEHDIGLLLSQDFDHAILVCEKYIHDEAVLLQLLKHKRPGLMRVLANKASFPSVLEPLSLSQDEETLQALASNPHASDEILTALFARAQHEQRSDLALCLAKQSGLPLPLLEACAVSADPQLRVEVAFNAALPRHFLPALLNDKDPVVRAAVVLRKDTASVFELDQVVPQLTEMACSQNVRMRFGVAEYPQCPANLLALLATDENEMVLARVAENPACPEAVLWTLFENGDYRVLSSLAKNTSTPMEMLRKLAVHTDSSPRYSLAYSLGCTIAAHEEIQLLLAKDPTLYIRDALASNSACLKSVLAQMAQDKSVKVRRSVASNPNTDLAVVQRLAGDADNTTAGIAANALKARSRR